MKHTLILLLFLSVAIEANAAIRSLGNSGYSTSKSNSNKKVSSPNIGSTPVINLKGKNTTIVCNQKGFTLTKCPSGYVPVLPCPNNDKFFKDCCPQDYRFSANNCKEKGLEPSKETCLGFHACRPPKEENNNK